MKWLESNPLGLALGVVGSLLLLLTLLLGWVWSWPVSSGADAADTAGPAALTVPKLEGDLGPLSEYQVVNDRPVFNESRRPHIEVEVEDEVPEIVDQIVAPTPEVRLTGVVITPDAKYVTLTPNEEGEPLIIREGMPLEGEYVGWSVSQIDARNATLKSTEGESLHIELAVHDAMIEEPPRPEPAKPAEEGKKAGGGEPTSRAEEIRQRIQDRREQLRREAEQAEEEKDEEKASQRNEYQEAIRSMMNRKRNKDEKSPEDEN